MKYLKLYNESISDIDTICKKYNITNYTINVDGSIDVDGDVDLTNLNLKLSNLPLKFNKISGDFHCYDSELTSLKGCPKSVGGNFSCDSNELTSLEGCPKSVGGTFYCSFNKLTTLSNCPESVGGNFYCVYNKLVDFRGFPEFYEGEIGFSNNPVEKILKKFTESQWCKAIYWINELDAIQNGQVVEERMREVEYQLKKSE